MGAGQWTTQYCRRCQTGSEATGIRYHSNIILEKPHVLVGKLVDANGRPVSRAKIRAVPFNNSIVRSVGRYVYLPEQWFTTETDVNGNFVFDNLALDIRVFFWVKAPGWNLEYVIHKSDYYRSISNKVGQTDIRLVLLNVL